MTLVQVSARGGHSGALQLLNFFFLSTSRYAWPQEISLSDLSPDCCDKTILDVKAMTLTLRSLQVSADGSISTSHLFHHNLKEEMMGRYLSPQETNEGFCAGVDETRQDFARGGVTPVLRPIRWITSTALLQAKQLLVCFNRPLPNR